MVSKDVQEAQLRAQQRVQMTRRLEKQWRAKTDPPVQGFVDTSALEHAK
ncbi:unnamed protein product [Echinostoma caproni]|uniref:Uncharacterized protein n=1 Tax=Echinostoma caproni TaxID=27848 RepID=A0A183B8S0_9TREM|nr:unnamed protein product [Echinostoma caproni]